jgi:hypothetical protein
MPSEQRRWLHEEPASPLVREQTGQACEERPVTRLQERPRHLATEHRHLVAKHDDLDRKFVPLGSAQSKELE